MAVARRVQRRNQAEIYLAIKIEPLDEGGFLATSNELQGFLAEGRTVAETLEIAQDVASKLIESHLEHGDPLPPKIQRALRKQARPRIKLTIPVVVEAEAS